MGATVSPCCEHCQCERLDVNEARMECNLEFGCVLLKKAVATQKVTSDMNRGFVRDLDLLPHRTIPPTIIPFRVARQSGLALHSPYGPNLGLETLTECRIPPVQKCFPCWISTFCVFVYSMRWTLKFHLVQMGTSQKRLARDLDISDSLVSAIVRGARHPDARLCRKIARELKAPEETPFSFGVPRVEFFKSTQLRDASEVADESHS
jgi:DNA-binding XRE family transcriptional regulator